MRSVELIGTRAGALVAALVAAGPLAGCATTQQEAARLQLNSARIRSSAHAVRVTRADPAVAVRTVQLIDGVTRSAVLVVIHNHTAQPISDLPISIGTRGAGGALRYLNAIAGLPYFGDHIPAISAHGTLHWIFTMARRLPGGVRLFALVGAPPSVTATRPRSLPMISAALIASTTVTVSSSDLSLDVRNRSGVPQYQLPVYAFVQRGSRYLAAGVATVAHLSSNASTTLHLRLLGALKDARLQIQTPPTIFQ
ncbi:MAG: hypothetical protein ACLP0J_18250 [Solirubrobacteraceae bacterium]